MRARSEEKRLRWLKLQITIWEAIVAKTEFTNESKTCEYKFSEKKRRRCKEHARFEELGAVNLNMVLKSSVSPFQIPLTSPHPPFQTQNLTLITLTALSHLPDPRETKAQRRVDNEDLWGTTELAQLSQFLCCSRLMAEARRWPLGTHGAQHSCPDIEKEDLLMYLESFPDIKDNDVVEIQNPITGHRFVLHARAWPIKSPVRSISLRAALAEEFSLATNMPVIVNRVLDVSQVTLEMVEVFFANTYVGRFDMLRLKNSLVNKCVHVRKAFVISAVKVEVLQLWRGDGPATTGVIGPETRIVFRSHSAAMYIMLHMCEEMWYSDGSGETFADKAVKFLQCLFASWEKKERAKHSVTIVLFGRCCYPGLPSLENVPEEQRKTLRRDGQGGYHEDLYRVLLLAARDEWRTVPATLKREFAAFAARARVWPGRTAAAPAPAPHGYLTKCLKSNFLEAINLQLNAFDKHYIDRNFSRTGLSLAIVTPGIGVVEAPRALVMLTKRRVLAEGVGCDLICLAEPPAYPTPLMHFTPQPRFKEPVDAGGDKASEEGQYHVASWIHQMFFNSHTLLMSESTLRMATEMPDRFLPLLNITATGPVPLKLPFDAPGSRTDASQESAAQYEQHDHSAWMLPETRTPPVRTGIGMRIRTSSSNHDVIPSPATNGTAAFEKPPETRVEGARGSDRALWAHPVAQRPEFNKLLPMENPGERGRWSQAMPPAGSRGQCGQLWKSMAMPACLPLTTDYLPSETVLTSDDFTVNSYTIVTDTPARAKEVFQSMQALRLMQTLQYFHRRADEHRDTRSDVHRGRSFSVAYKPKPVGTVVWMCFVDIVHRLELRGLEILVSIFKPKKMPDFRTMEYTYRLFPRGQDRAIARSCTFEGSLADRFLWSTVDEVAARPDIDMSLNFEQLRFWRTRFALIPLRPGQQDNAAALEAILAAFNKKIQQMARDKEKFDLDKLARDGPGTSKGPPVSATATVALTAPILADTELRSAYAAAAARPATNNQEPLRTPRFILAANSPAPPHDRELLSRFVQIVVDSQREEEWALVFYDSNFHRDRVFHLEFHWLAATAAHVHKTALEFCRLCSKQFRMVAIPVLQSLYEKTNNAAPFFAPVLVPLAPIAASLDLTDLGSYSPPATPGPTSARPAESPQASKQTTPQATPATSALGSPYATVPLPLPATAAGPRAAMPGTPSPAVTSPRPGSSVTPLPSASADPAGGAGVAAGTGPAAAGPALSNLVDAALAPAAAKAAPAPTAAPAGPTISTTSSSSTGPGGTGSAGSERRPSVGSVGPSGSHQKFLEAILVKFGFMLDVAANFPVTTAARYNSPTPLFQRPQYIHETGELIVQICDDGFAWMVNPLFATLQTASMAAAHKEKERDAGAQSARDVLLDQFTAFCRNPDALLAFHRFLQSRPGPVSRDELQSCTVSREDTLLSGAGSREDTLRSTIPSRDELADDRSGPALPPTASSLLSDPAIRADPTALSASTLTIGQTSTSAGPTGSESVRRGHGASEGARRASIATPLSAGSGDVEDVYGIALIPSDHNELAYYLALSRVRWHML
eukprot:m.215044 g.215044  ORF g.215044 m.215044 type:complete len:1558 (+) comp15588_c0_seq24:940-5613(+)